jgi:phenylalanyl-tRNA synthetase beta chain
MVRINCSHKTLQQLIGNQISVDQINDVLFDMGMELKGQEGDILDVEITAERFDLMSEAGLARAIRAYAGYGAAKQYTIESTNTNYVVQSTLPQVRPYTVAVVVKGLHLNDETLKSVIDVQEKLHATLCRKRKKAAIGIYPLEKISWPITYSAKPAHDIQLTPLGESETMSAQQMIATVSTAKQYAHLLSNDLSGDTQIPFFADATGKVLSVPPLLNSEEVGRVTTQTSEVFVEVSGFDKSFLDEILTLLSTMFVELGGQLHAVTIQSDQPCVTPEFKSTQRELHLSQVKKYLGLDLSIEEVSALSKKMMYEPVSAQGDSLILKIPCFRTDIWHEVDIVDDIARAYGYNDLPITIPQVQHSGSILPITRLQDTINNVCVGLGLLQAHTFSLTSKTVQLDHMNITSPDFIPVVNGLDTQDMMRINVLPELLTVLVENRNRRMPQKLFECATVVHTSAETDTGAVNKERFASLITDNQVTYTQIRQVLDTIGRSLGKTFEIHAQDYPFMIPGRSGTVLLDGEPIGFIGEIHPKVLNNFGLIRPVVACEIELEPLL